MKNISEKSSEARAKKSIYLFEFKIIRVKYSIKKKNRRKRGEEKLIALRCRHRYFALRKEK